MPARDTGLSLVELMVALAIGAVLSLAVSNLFLRSRISYLQEVQLARLQENGRYALRYLSHELGMAGYQGGLLHPDRVSRDRRGSGCFERLLEIAVPLTHYDDLPARKGPPGTGSGPVPGCLAGRNYLGGTDALLVRRTLDAPTVERGEVLAALDPNTLYLQLGEHGARASLEPGGARTGTGVDLWEYHPQLLFLRRYSRSAADGIPTLCRLRLAPGGRDLAPLECLVEGVEDMQLEFGIDEDGDQVADRYLPAPGSRELERAVSARLYLLLRSVHPVYGYRNRHGYRLGGKYVPAANDAYFRRLFQTTVILRNAGVWRL